MQRATLVNDGVQKKLRISPKGYSSSSLIACWHLCAVAIRLPQRVCTWTFFCSVCKLPPFGKKKNTDGDPSDPKKITAQMKPFAQPAMCDRVAKVKVSQVKAKQGKKDSRRMNESRGALRTLALHPCLQKEKNHPKDKHNQACLPPNFQEPVLLVKERDACPSHQRCFGQQIAGNSREYQ